MGYEMRCDESFGAITYHKEGRYDDKEAGNDGY